jgi:hypothetical protein
VTVGVGTSDLVVGPVVADELTGGDDGVSDDPLRVGLSD